MKKAPSAHTPYKHWYVLTVANGGGISCLTAVRKPFWAEAKAYSKKLKANCEILRFERIPAVKAYGLLRAFISCKPYGDVRPSISKALSYAEGVSK